MITSLIGLGGVALTAVAAFLGSWLQRRSMQEQMRAQAEAAQEQMREQARSAQKSAEHLMIDQLQEELKGYRAASDARATAQDERMNRLEQYSDGYRSHAHELRSWIWDGRPPPPPPWPEGLPK
ncbi:hypothetical protein MUN78_06905 [Leucobacter allii]|uniref:Uncharacterized protein n=1 Tax=Leucobacter allii TaxID=2932247 RepID=A0ABY4FQI7_9MICO|nr:hypothetical protein [Leucobacter allii]UOQ58545.1 hypothetical protein MUN78_06905 [Leucobacter allii]